MAEHRKRKRRTSSARRPRALVVDLDEFVLIALERVLEDVGIETTTAWTPEQACHELRAGAYDVLVVGHHPPHIDAEEALRCRGAAACVVLLPGRLLPVEAATWQQRGALVACKWEWERVQDVVLGALGRARPLPGSQGPQTSRALAS